MLWMEEVMPAVGPGAGMRMCQGKSRAFFITLLLLFLD
jgi:hypothetical protein